MHRVQSSVEERCRLAVLKRRLDRGAVPNTTVVAVVVVVV